MKRRNFLKSIAGLFAAVSLPASAAIKPEKDDMKPKTTGKGELFINKPDGSRTKIGSISSLDFTPGDGITKTITAAVRTRDKNIKPTLDDLFRQVLPDGHPMKPT